MSCRRRTALSLLLVAGLCACGSDGPAADAPSSPAPSTEYEPDSEPEAFPESDVDSICASAVDAVGRLGAAGHGDLFDGTVLLVTEDGATSLWETRLGLTLFDGLELSESTSWPAFPTDPDDPPSDRLMSLYEGATNSSSRVIVPTDQGSWSCEPAPQLLPAES